MGRGAYPAEMKQEKREMKKRLWDWGHALERFHWKEGELEKLQIFHEMQKQVWEESDTGQREEELERLERAYKAEIGRLRIEMVEILREKAEIDGLIRGLSMDEKKFLHFRYEKGYGFDYIGMKMYLSRATLFRMQDRLLEKMVLSMEEEQAA